MLATQDVGKAREAKSALNAVLSPLTRSERRLFRFLLRYRGEWVPRSRICLSIYGAAGPDEHHAVAMHLCRMVRKLEARGASWHIDRTKGALRLQSQPRELAS